MSETSDKPEGSQLICDGKALQNGGSLLASRPLAVTELDDNNGLEGCLLSSAHPPRLSILPFLPVGGNLQVLIPTSGFSAASRVFTKLVNPVVGFPRQTDCCLILYLANVLMMHQEELSWSKLTCQLFESLGLMKEIHTDSCSEVGFSLMLNDNEIITIPEKLSKFNRMLDRCCTKHPSW